MKNFHDLFPMRVILDSYAEYCRPLCRELNLPQMAFDILMFFANNPDYYTANDFTRICGFKANIVSVNVDKLVREGYLSRESDPEDRRKNRLLCTEKASEIISRGRKIQKDFLAAVVKDIPENELAVMVSTFGRIAENASKINSQK